MASRPALRGVDRSFCGYSIATNELYYRQNGKIQGFRKINKDEMWNMQPHQLLHAQKQEAEREEIGIEKVLRVVQEAHAA